MSKRYAPKVVEEVIDLLNKGKTYAEVAKKTGMSKYAVNYYHTQSRKKAGVTGLRAEQSIMAPPPKSVPPVDQSVMDKLDLILYILRDIQAQRK